LPRAFPDLVAPILQKAPDPPRLGGTPSLCQALLRRLRQQTRELVRRSLGACPSRLQQRLFDLVMRDEQEYRQHHEDQRGDQQGQPYP
jgi:hypothetical protein